MAHVVKVFLHTCVTRFLRCKTWKVGTEPWTTGVTEASHVRCIKYSFQGQGQNRIDGAKYELGLNAPVKLATTSRSCLNNARGYANIFMLWSLIKYPCKFSAPLIGCDWNTFPWTTKICCSLCLPSKVLSSTRVISEWLYKWIGPQRPSKLKKSTFHFQLFLFLLLCMSGSQWIFLKHFLHHLQCTFTYAVMHCGKMR